MVLDLIRRLVPRSSPMRQMTVLIQVPKVPDGVVETGPRQVLDDYFITPGGRNKTLFTNTDDVEKTAAAVMQMLRFDHNRSDYEIVSRKPNSKKARQYYVVWFPKADEFDSWVVLYEPRIRLLTPQLTTLHEAIHLAEAQRQNKTVVSTE